MENGLQPRVIAAGRVIASGGDLSPGVVEVEGGRIVRIREGRAGRADLHMPDGILAPGLIDLQVNGVAGVDFLTAGTAELARARRFLLSTGVTAFLPTLISSPRKQLEAALDRWSEAARDGVPRIPGVHVEGPFLNRAYAGAHDPRYLRRPNAAQLRILLDRHPRLVKLVTLAPELPGARSLVRLASDRGSLVAAGHTAATYDEAQTAFGAGVRLVTHLFNAMRPLHHRDPGIVGAALQDPRVTVSLIADLIHVDPAVLRLVFALKPWQRIVLITDAVAAAGRRTRSARLATRLLRVTDAPRLPSGTLAGSLLTLDQAVRNVVRLGVPLRQAVLMASTVPATLLRRRDLGRIAPGARADIVLFDRVLRVWRVLVEGAVVFTSDRRHR